MNKIIPLYLVLFQCVFSADSKNAGASIVPKNNIGTESLGRIGDYGYPGNPHYDRAKGFLLKGKIKNAVSNNGNFITWDYHPAGFWGEYGYLPHVGFVAGVPGHEYSSHWSEPGDPSWIEDNNIISLWYSEDAYDAWVDGIDPPLFDNDGNFKTNEAVYKTIVYETVIDVGSGDKGHNDRGKIALEITGYCDDDFCLDRDNCNEDICKNMVACQSVGYEWIEAGISQINPDNGTQWFLDHELGRVNLYLTDTGSDPNYASSGIGLAFPWSIRPKFKSRTAISGGFYFDLYNYGNDQEEWTCDDEYVYYGATFDESWFVRDGNPSVKTDWQASTDARYTTHNIDNKAGDLFGDTEFTDPADPDNLLSHSAYPATWPKKYSFDAGAEIPFWPGWWSDEYYGESPDLWSSVGIYDCNGTRSDEGCWKPLPNRHISDMDVYMEFDDRWANVGNRVEDNEEEYQTGYVSAGYPMGIKVMSMAHSYGVAYAEDVMFVTVKVRNESGDYCVFEKDRNWYANGLEIFVKDDDNNVICDDGMVMPDGTKLNRGKGFNYKKLYLGFYMDADVLSTDATGGYSVHTNADDFMKYIDCKVSKVEYPDGCPIVNDDTLRISMALIGDYDGISSSAKGYSMETDSEKGSDFGIVAVQLLDSPYATGYVDLDQDGFYDIYPGEKLKMTDWHWFDWYARPGVKSGYQTNDNPAQNKELMQYQVIAGDNTNLTTSERTRYFHSRDPETDYDSDINPHFDSLEGLKLTSFFTGGDAPGEGLDCVLEMSTGPFDLEVGEQVSFSFSIIFGQNIDDLLKNAKFAQIMYNSHYQGYTPPIIPNVMAVSGHQKVTLYWDDVSVESRDVITNYSDFEGYKIYRSIDGGETWGFPDEEILIDNTSQGWQPLSVGCIDNPSEDTQIDLGCESYNKNTTCIYSNLSTYERRDANNNDIDDCYWKYAQFDLSAEADSAFCIYGKDEDNHCIYTSQCNSPCTRDPASTCCREADVQGPDPQAEWLNLGYNTGLDVILIDPDNPDSVYVCDDENFCCGVNDSDNGILITNAPDCYSEGTLMLVGDITKYQYKFVDNNVTDGMEYTYSVVAYDRGVPGELVEYIPTNDEGTSFTKVVSSIPDPANWGKINSFQLIESPKGTTVHDPNFVQIIPGYLPGDNLDYIRVVPNPYIVHSDYNETEYKRKIRFTRLPPKCSITIFTISGEKVRELDHNNSEDGNTWWDLRSYNNQEVAPGLYIYVVEAPSGNKKIGKFAIVR